MFNNDNNMDATVTLRLVKPDGKEKVVGTKPGSGTKVRFHSLRRLLVRLFGTNKGDL